LPALAFAAAAGLAVGSFLNVVIHRVPRGQSVVRPGSRCPHCGVPIRPWHNVPVLSWLVLRGRCAACGGPIGARYPLVEAATAALFVAVTARFGTTAALPAYLVLIAASVALAVLAAETGRLPGRVVLPAVAAGAAMLAVATVAGGDRAAGARAVVAAGGLGALAVAALRSSPARSGAAALAALLGAHLGWLGWPTLLAAAVASLLLAGLAGLAAPTSTRRTTVVIGPSVLAAATLAILLVEPIFAWYLSIRA
jgi:leader peptidase (prepilin peptidase)/N-methyltransferase